MLLQFLHTMPFASARRPVRTTHSRLRAVLGLALTFLASAVSSVNAADYRERVLSTNPAFYWTLDDTDLAQPAANLGSKTIAATYADVMLGAEGLATGIAGNKAVTFDGTASTIAIPDAADINNAIQVERTIELWFNANDVSGTVEQVLWEEGGRSRGVNLYVREGNLYFGAWNQPNDDVGVSSPWISGEGDPEGGFIFLNTPIESGKTYHAALVIDGDPIGKSGTLTGYLDGTVIGQKIGVGRLFAHGDNVAIGATAENTYFDSKLGAGAGNYFSGVVDEVSLFNRALSSDAINIHLGATFTPGDFNADTKVDLSDLAILVSNLNKPGNFASGDATLDGHVDLNDFVALREAFSKQGAAAVPEPSSLLLLGLGTLGLAVVRLRRQARRVGPVAVVAGIAALSGVAQAEELTWKATPSGNWNEASNWDLGSVPNTSQDDVAVIGNGGTAIISSDVPSVLELRVNSGALELQAGKSFASDGAAVIGAAGDIRLLGNAQLNVGTNLSTSGKLSLSWTAKLQATGNLGLGGTLQISAAGSQVSQLSATGAANLGGKLVVDVSAADAVAGKSWDFIQADSFAGKFQSIAPLTQENLAYGLELRSIITGNTAKLEVDNLPILTINRSTGAASIKNVIGDAIDFKGYQITSPSGLLKPDAFSGFAASNAQWTEANPNSKSLAELNLTGSSSLAVGSSLPLGSIYAAGNIAPKNEDVRFTFGGPDGEVRQGLIQYEGAPNDLVLNIDPATGKGVISNLSPFFATPDITGYSILSTGGSLNPTGWTGFADSGKAGTGWSEAPGRSDALAEVNLQNSFAYSNGKYVELGQIFTPGSARDLKFQYSTVAGAMLEGTVLFSAFTPSTPTLAGDANSDGKVDLTDFGILKSNFGTGNALNQGDFNGDAKVDLTDFGILKSNFGKSGVAAAVPEPSSVVLLLLGLAGGAVRFRRRAAKLLTLAAVLFATSATTVKAAWLDEVLLDEPFALFRFDDPAGSEVVGDASPAAELQATYSGGITLETKSLVPGDNNSAVKFEGVDGTVAIVNSPLINTGGPFVSRTVEFWFQATDANTATPQVLFEEGGTARGLNLYIQNGQLFAGAWNNAADDAGLSTPWVTGDGDPVGSVFVSTPIESGKAYHAALTYDGDPTGKSGAIRGFLDGVVFGAESGVGRLFAHTGAIGIGAKRGDTLFQTGGSTGTGNYFSGVIDDFALYTAALSPQRIAAHLGVTITPGDFNSDGKVDLSDFGVLKDNFSTGTKFSQGDATLDGQVDLADFFAFAKQFGSPGAAEAVPEPSTWLLALAATGGLTIFRLRRAGGARKGNL